MKVYVVDTGSREVYLLAPDEFDAAERVAALGEGFNYVELYSEDPADLPDDESVVLR